MPLLLTFQAVMPLSNTHNPFMETRATRYEEEPPLPAAPIPWHARHHTGGGYGCTWCGKRSTDLTSMRRYEAPYCCKIGG